MTLLGCKHKLRPVMGTRNGANHSSRSSLAQSHTIQRNIYSAKGRTLQNGEWFTEVMVCYWPRLVVVLKGSPTFSSAANSATLVTNAS